MSKIDLISLLPVEAQIDLAMELAAEGLNDGAKIVGTLLMDDNGTRIPVVPMVSFGGRFCMNLVTKNESANVHIYITAKEDGSILVEYDSKQGTVTVVAADLNKKSGDH